MSVGVIVNQSRGKFIPCSFELILTFYERIMFALISGTNQKLKIH